jgi:hypothetical protein
MRRDAALGSVDNEGASACVTEAEPDPAGICHATDSEGLRVSRRTKITDPSATRLKWGTLDTTFTRSEG